MANRSLNKVMLIGNLTRDPEIRYTPSGTAVCTFGLATNRSWTTDAGEKKEEAEFHRIVSWHKLAEICGKFLIKGRKVYLEGRLQTRAWTGQDGQQRQTTEIVIDDMIILDSRRVGEETTYETPPPPVSEAKVEEKKSEISKPDDAKAKVTVKAEDKKADDKKKKTKEKDSKETQNMEENVPASDIPF